MSARTRSLSAGTSAGVRPFVSIGSRTRTTAVEYAGKKVRVNAILPGLMHTPMIDFLAEQYAKNEKDHNQAYDKMIAIRASDPIAVFNHPIGNGYKLAKCTQRFVEVNELQPLEQRICECLSYLCDDAMLRVARDTLQTLLQRAGAGLA